MQYATLNHIAEKYVHTLFYTKYLHYFGFQIEALRVKRWTCEFLIWNVSFSWLEVLISTPDWLNTIMCEVIDKSAILKWMSILERDG